MNILYGAYYTILRNLRDWKYLVLLIAAPILTIMLTGVSTDHINKLKNTEKVSIIYYSEDSGDIAKSFNSFISAGQIKDAFEVVKGKTLDDARKKVSDGKAEALIYFPKDFSKDFSSGKKSDITVYSSRKATPAKPLVESFINTFNSGLAVKIMGGVSIIPNIDGNVKEVPISATGSAPSGLDYWTYANMLIYFFYSAIMCAFTIINEFKKHTIVRVDSAPIYGITNIIGKIIGNVVTLFGCVIILIVFTKYAFNSNWNGNMAVILSVYFLYCIIVNCLGFILGLLTRKIGIVVLLVICSNVLLLMGAGGGWGQNGGVFLKLSVISPHYYVLRALNNNIFNGIAERVNSSIVALGVMAAVMLGLTIFLGRRKVR